MKTFSLGKINRGSPAKPVRHGTSGAELVIAFVGAGGAFTKPSGRGETNLVLVHGTTHVAIDCGRLWPEAFPASTGLRLADIDAFVISHAHADHANGLATAAQECRWIQNRKPGLVLPHALEPFLWDETLKGGLAHDTSPESTVGDYFDVIRPKAIDERTSTVIVGDLELELFRTCHAPGAAESWRDAMVSYGIYVPKFNVFISMDTRFDRELVERYAERGAEWFFHDATRAGNVHATIDELRMLPESIRESMLLMHTPDNLRADEATGFVDRLGMPSIVERGDVFYVTPIGSF